MDVDGGGEAGGVAGRGEVGDGDEGGGGGGKGGGLSGDGEIRDGSGGKGGGLGGYGKAGKMPIISALNDKRPPQWKQSPKSVTVVE